MKVGDTMKVDRLLSNARRAAERRNRPDIEKAVIRMTTEQLIEIAYRDLPDERLNEILASVNALDSAKSG